MSLIGSAMGPQWVRKDIAMKLTEKIIATLTCEAGQKDRLVFDDTVRGLGLRISSKGAKNFLVQFRSASGIKRRLPLGTWGSITLEQARQGAKTALGQVASGRDPFADREIEKARAQQAADGDKLTLSALLSDWQSIGLASNRPSYRKEAVRAVAVAFEAYLKRRADALQKADVVKALDGLVKAGKGALANRTAAYGRACYSWAVKRGRLGENPFAGLPSLATVKSRDRVLNDEEIGAIARATDALGYPFGPLLKLLLLTAQRRDEVATMQWSEISPDLSTWTQPASKTKNKQGHIVHLAPEARAILVALPRRTDTDFVFSTNGKTAVSGFSKAKARLDELIDTREAIGTIADWRFHDFRRSCVTWLAGAGFNPAVADKILNHVTATGMSAVGQVYQRAAYLRERQQALEAWAHHVATTSARIPSGGNVLSFSGGVQ
jgi:integrase